MTIPEVDDASGTMTLTRPRLATASDGTGTRQRLGHIDAMRPVKQAGVVSTHALLAFAPAGTAVAVGASLMLLHVTREAFLFVSACMLTYSCSGWRITDPRTFYRRRLTLVGLPYVTWTLIYWVFTWSKIHGAWGLHAGHFFYLLATGYYQLYYLVVLLQFYAVFPVALALVRRCANRHGMLIIVSAAIQVGYVSLMHWNVLPPGLRGSWATREVISYQFYLIGGMVVAMHLDEVHRWLCAHVAAALAFTLASAGVAEAWFFLATDRWSWLGSSSDPFQPIVIPFNVGMIALIYLLGVWLAHARRSPAVQSAVRSGSDNAYGVFLAQMVFVTALGWVGWNHLDNVVPWPLVCFLSVILIFLACVALSGVAARTPLARALTGRARVQPPWRGTAGRPSVPVPAPVVTADVTAWKWRPSRHG